MEDRLVEIYEEWQQAVKPEDIFGMLNGAYDLINQDKLLEQKCQEFLEIVNPENYSNISNQEIAESAKIILDKYYGEAKQLVAVGGYGNGRHRLSISDAGLTKFRANNGEYLLGEAFVEGDYCTLYEGQLLIGNEAVKVAIKIADDPSNNHMILREARAFKQLYEERGTQLKHLPILLDQFQTEDNRSALIYRYLDDCYDLYTVRENCRYQNGVPRKHMVWVLNRLLSALGYIHSLGRLHGNIDPSHLMIRPRDHNLFLVGWGHSVYSPKVTGEKFTVFNPEFSAPEVQENEIILPSADIYSAGMCMIYLLGGDVESKTIPGDIEDELARFLGSLVMESPLQRQQDAWVLHGQLDTLVKKLWGRKKFLVFDI